jgi:hypothetical protein
MRIVVVLIQMLLPFGSAARDDARFRRTREELIATFGGLTAYSRAPARGEWLPPDGPREVDELVVVEIVAPEFDRTWWRGYAETLAARFEQQVIHVRAMHIEVLDPAAT